MTGLVRAEWRKLLSTAAAWWLAAGAVALTAVSTAGTILANGREGGGPGGGGAQALARVLDSPAGVRNVIASAGAGDLFVLLLGVLALTSEYRHATITQSFLTTPQRGRLVAAKLAALGVVGLAVSVLDCIVNLAMALPWLGTRHLHTAVVTGDTGVVLATVLVGTTLYALLGVGVGALVRNQVAAVVISLAWLLVLDGLLIGLVPAAGRWTPGGAAASLHRNLAPTAHFLPAWGGGLLLVAYALAFAGAGTRLVLRRDVT